MSTATGCPGSTSCTTWLMRSRVPCSSPLVRLTTGTHGRRQVATCSSVSRKPWDGTPMTSTSASCTASSDRARGPQLRVEPVARQVVAVLVLVVDLVGELLAARPQDRGLVVRREVRDGRAPRSGPDHRHSDRHAARLRAPRMLVRRGLMGHGRPGVRTWRSPVDSPAMPGTHVLVPIKSFRNAKVRLAGALPPSERAALARRMADRVLAAAGLVAGRRWCATTSTSRRSPRPATPT